MRRFTEKTRNSLSRKPQLTTCDEAALDAEEAERLLRAGIEIVVFNGTEEGLDETARRLQDEIEYLAWGEKTGTCYAVNSEGFDYARYFGYLGPRRARR
jgi:hypothetical protein